MDVTDFIMSHITGELSMTLVIDKQLLESDLDGNQNRLIMPYQMFNFLTCDEKAHLDNGCEIDVQVLGPTLQMYERPMKLVKWRTNSTQAYVLKTNWSNFVQENKDDLKQGATIQVWSIRWGDQKKLCLAIVVVKRAESFTKNNPEKFKPVTSKWQRFGFGSFARGMKISCVSKKVD